MSDLDLPPGARLVTAPERRVRPRVAKVLPVWARDVLVEAAESPEIGREVRIDDAIRKVRTKYPQFFQTETEA